MKQTSLTFPQRFLKRVFDVFFSFFGLLLSLPIIFIAWLVATIETRSNGFFTQVRIGQHGKHFRIVKIKTMKKVVNHSNTTITSANDARITKSGAFFRKTKIDELPQLWNILIGKMSFVGPRPDVPGYADKLIGEDQLILQIKPGITSPASLKYRNEEEILANQNDYISYNNEVIWPDKVKINLNYIRDYSFKKDIKYIYLTIVGK